MVTALQLYYCPDGLCSVSTWCDALPRLLVGMGADRLFEIFKVEIGYVPSVSLLHWYCETNEKVVLEMLCGASFLCGVAIVLPSLQHGSAG